MDADGPRRILSPGPEEETIARKRARRVSFADTTAVHVFDRDEDFETPPEERSASASVFPSPSPRRSSADGDDTSDGDSPPLPIIFRPDIDSSSPGSAAESVVSADDENFFGPVSTSFIQTGRPSDAGMSEDGNHDITLDSRTFSMHFLNTAIPDDCTANSVGSLRTPNTASKGHLVELNVSDPRRKSSSGQGTMTDMSTLTGSLRTPNTASKGHIEELNVSEPGNSGRDALTDMSMLTGSLRTPHTASKGHLEELNVSEPGRKSSSGRDSSTEMSMLTGSPRSYGYGHLPPLLKDMMQKIEQGQRRNSPITGIADVNHDGILAFTATEEDNTEENSCGGHGVSSKELGSFSITEGRISMRNPVSTSSDPIQENNARTAVQQLEVPQDSILSPNSQRQELFSATPISNCKVSCPEADSLSVEFVKHDNRISALENLLKVRLQESPAAFQLPWVEGDGLGLQATDIFISTEDQATCNSVRRRQLKKTGESFTPGGPLGQGPNESANIQSTSCDVLTLGSQFSRECNFHLDLDGGGRNRSVKDNGHAVHEWPEETSKPARSPKNSRKQLTSASELSVSLKVSKEKQSGDNDSGQSVNVDWNKVVCTISNATEQVLAPAISKLNLQQLDTLGDKLDDLQMARKYRRLSIAVRVEDCCGDRQKKLAEARSLHERLLYERAKLQINNAKLAALQNKSQQCQLGIQECSFLKRKILGVAHNASCHETSLICSSNGQEPPAIVSKKRLEYNVIQQKVESLRSSLSSAEEQSDIRNLCHIIHRQAGLPELMDVVKRDNKRDVILNYRNLLFQRIILNIRDVSSIFVSNSLNDTKIGQTFPDLDALVAFNYIFRAEENQSVSDLQLLQKKTMETSLLVGNLAELLDEIKFAKMKLLNLTSATFVLESPTGQLALCLCFMSFKSGKSICFTIDMTDLNRSVYPSEPSELLIKLCQAQTTTSQPTIDEIMVSIRNLQPGRTVILRLCQMVSQLIQSLPC